MGKVESGTLRMDDEIAIAPTKKKAKVDAIYVGDDKVRSAKVRWADLYPYPLSLPSILIQTDVLIISPE